jgi:hypothetical protein
VIPECPIFNIVCVCYTHAITEANIFEQFDNLISVHCHSKFTFKKYTIWKNLDS